MILFVKDFQSADYYDALPSFSANVIDFLYSDKIGIKQDSVIADVGAGTGRLCIPFLKRGNNVIAIEPDANMRKICDTKCSNYANYQSVEGTDVQMNIEDQSIDFVIASQVYHRFDEDGFKKECQRVLKNPQNVIIIWYRIDFNNPVYDAMLRSVKSRFSKYETRYTLDEIMGAAIEAKENNDSAVAFFQGKSKMETIISEASLSKDEFIKLGLSLSLFPITHEMNTVSKVLESEYFDLPNYINDLELIFDRYAINNLITLQFEVQIHIGI